MANPNEVPPDYETALIEIGRLRAELRLKEEENRELREQRKSIIQGELLKNTLRANNLWNSYVAKDAQWLAFPVEMRNWIEVKIAARNENAHPDIENIAD